MVGEDMFRILTRGRYRAANNIRSAGRKGIDQRLRILGEASNEPFGDVAPRLVFAGEDRISTACKSPSAK
jgi:hypothetical protein